MGRSSSILPTAIYCNHQCSTTVNNDQIAIVSPQTSNVSVIYELWLFDSSQMTLTTNISLDIDIQAACVTSSMTGSLIYLLGGAQKGGDRDVLNTSRIYDTNTKQWVRINNTMNIARSSASCQFHNDRLYIFGGTTFDSDLGTRTKTKSIEVYDMDSGQWTLLDDTLSVVMNDAQALLADPIIFIMGGHGTSWTSFTMDAFVIHDTDDNLYDSYALPDTNRTHFYGIFMVDDIRQRLIAVSGQEWDDHAGEIASNMFLEYSNKMNNVAFLEQNEPTAAPIVADIYDQIEDEIANILEENEFLNPSTWSMFTRFVVAIVSSLVILSYCAFCQHKCSCKCCGCRGADDVEWWRLFRYSLQVYDLFT
eukprot:1075365_1